MEKAGEVAQNLKNSLSDYQQDEQNVTDCAPTTKVSNNPASVKRRILSVVQQLLSSIDVNSGFDVRLV